MLPSPAMARLLTGLSGCWRVLVAAPVAAAQNLMVWSYPAVARITESVDTGPTIVRYETIDRTRTGGES